MWVKYRSLRLHTVADFVGIINDSSVMARQEVYGGLGLSGFGQDPSIACGPLQQSLKYEPMHKDPSLHGRVLQQDVQS